MGKLRVEHDVGHRAIGMWFGRDDVFFGYRILVNSVTLLHALVLSSDGGKTADKRPTRYRAKKEMNGPSGVLTEAQGPSRSV